MRIIFTKQLIYSELTVVVTLFKDISYRFKIPINIAWLQVRRHVQKKVWILTGGMFRRLVTYK